ncbi:hypothetical protein [Microbacterium arborescens]|jgi:hypothetical protein|uniref:hypothetical protein n=1 Tax=Microbacterium TaxID=33882 RepID=UPI0025A2E5BA|nr:hypothetical protein [Microbacterium arborescens]MDF2580708.1 hypothetical protein [Microbacterium sp.]WJM15398.1 hypothetical protein QUC20_14130 [Microbacterium arborescens]
MIRTKTTTSAALLVSAALLLAGCGGQADDTAASGDAGASPAPSSSTSSSAPAASAPDVAPASGETITGTGYSFSVPEGWAVPEQAVPGTERLDVFVADLSDPTAAFADNVNVVLSPEGQTVTPEQIEKDGVEQLETQAGATDVAVAPRTVIAGGESAHITASVTQQGATYNVDQFYASDGDRTYVVTFSFSPEVSEADRAAVYDSVLASWAWA